MNREREQLRGIIARGYCHEKNAAKVLDGDLLEAIVDELLAAAPVEPRVVELAAARLDGAMEVWRGPISQQNAIVKRLQAEHAALLAQPAPLCPICKLPMSDGNGCHMSSQPAPDAPVEPPLTKELAEKIWQDVQKLVTLECGCIIDGNTVGLCAKHYSNWRISLAAATPVEQTITIPLRLAGELGIFDKLKERGYKVVAGPAAATGREAREVLALAKALCQLFNEITGQPAPFFRFYAVVEPALTAAEQRAREKFASQIKVMLNDESELCSKWAMNVVDRALATPSGAAPAEKGKL